MRPIIDHNHLFVGISPLFRVQVGSGSQVKDIWVYNEAERDKVVKEHRSRKVQITRFKGLGEMNPQTLWSTTLNPATRNLLRIKIEDGERANIMFRSLLGKESGDRYRMIHENAHRLNLDL
jgi:DNA gyrase/topoisomerase IV subunit B